MEEIAVVGVVLSAMPYKEKDKLINIFSVELGKITAILKGVNSSNAKLKFAGQAFCFAKFELAKSNSKDFYTVKGAELFETFFDITTDYDKYSCGLAMLEVSSAIMKPNIISESLFLTLIKSLQNITYNGIDHYLSLLKFITNTLDIIGYALNFDKCDNCGMKFVGDIKFNTETGTFRCSACSGGVVIPMRDYTSIKIINNTDIGRLHTIKIDEESRKRILRILILNICEKVNFKLKSLNLNNI